MAVCKTTSAAADAAQSRLRALHPYEVPEILRVPVSGGWPDYLAWVRAQAGTAPPG
jgi:periplasmic divalent cation tolerance protein